MTSVQRYLPVFGRVLLAVLFVMSGISKLTDPAGTIGYIHSAGLPLPNIAYGIALTVELLGGILLIVGYRTRLVALILAVFTVAAAIGFHAHFADQNQMIHFMKNIAIAGGLLQIVAFGAGAFSLDSRLGKA
ncbi:DoxX family protein [Asticcacaulis sp.]|uniref:DoxX family protein n=1 Tax=Asticcacaulis sp. TaxID=1872648 RepID=UPI002C2D656C|nr:DoxX family protein [Asticcacaulis sp.]HTM81109.1 DoxX family protein [Asticcacaulis sp.]